MLPYLAKYSRPSGLCSITHPGGRGPSSSHLLRAAALRARSSRCLLCALSARTSALICAGPGNDGGAAAMGGLRCVWPANLGAAAGDGTVGDGRRGGVGVRARARAIAASTSRAMAASASSLRPAPCSGTLAANGAVVGEPPLSPVCMGLKAMACSKSSSKKMLGGTACPSVARRFDGEKGRKTRED